MPDSVRLALPAEAAAITDLQRRGWQQRLPREVSEPLLRRLEIAPMQESWAAAIQRPPLAQLRVLVALGDAGPVGFAAIGPAADPDATPGSDGQIAEFVIDPAVQREGHGSRLLQACVDTLRADGFQLATWWVRAADDPLRDFLIGAGWGPDGAHREVALDDAAPRVKFLRLHTAID